MPQTPGLFAPADDRNALTTPRARLLWPANARCNGAPRSETKMEGELGLPFQCPQRAQIHPRAVGNLYRVIICRELSDADQIIKSKHGGTDRRRNMRLLNHLFQRATSH